ncbi:MAG: hypothetical protein JWP63_6479 [Candidatus Solibacter sp.]|nr:hypothetical protein [Candidatus Solibacter sp.]
MQPDGRGAVQINGFLGTHAVFDVAEAFLGMEGVGKRVEIRTGMGGGDCGYGFQRGQAYVVYAYKGADGVLVASICSRTSPVEQAQADLDYLRGVKKAGPTGYLYGVAADSEGGNRFDETLRTWIPSGVSGVAVTLTGAGKSAQAVTSDNGEFRFDGLAPGKYKVAVAKDGYSLRYALAEFDVHAGGCAYAMESLVVNRRIVGRVMGADGLPAANIQVQLVPTRPNERYPLPFPVAETRTGNDGSYELRNVPAGEYYVGINLAHTPTEEMPYARYFYPGTEDPSRAGVALVKREAGTGTYNFTIPSPQGSRRVEGFVYWPDGRPAEKVSILLEDLRWPWQTNAVLAQTDAKGHFEISAFDGTAYRIHAVSRGARTTDSVSAEPLRLDPGTDVSKPLRLILTHKGNSTAELAGKGLLGF